jgi:predicted Rossmann fold nucleotide-binding protein DprA/Smf involved in DNA uptake
VQGAGTVTTVGDVRQQQDGPADRIRRLTKGGSEYPDHLLGCLRAVAPDVVWARGDVVLVSRGCVALTASRRCPGSPIVQAMDLARALRDAGVVVVSGFHSPLERDCFGFLVRGDQGVIWCPARTIGPYRIPRERQQAVDEGRLLLLSPFDSTHRRQTAELARRRNEFVAALADVVIIAYADPGGSLESLAPRALDWGKPVLTLAVPETENLVALGAEAFTIEEIVARCEAPRTSAIDATCGPEGRSHG